MADNELFPLVDAEGNVVGKATRGECHSGSKLLHPVVHLHVVDSNRGILLQRRSMDKDIQPGKWDTAVGGHVDYGEDVETALLRESREELGLADFEHEKILCYVFESSIEKELVNTFITRDYNGEIVFDPVEIDEVRYWSVDEVEKSLGKGVFTPNFEQEFNKIKSLIFK